MLGSTFINEFCEQHNVSIQTFDINRFVWAAALYILPVLFITGCMNEKKSDKIVDPDTIYFDYQVTGEEGNDNLTILLQYRDGGEEEDAVSAGHVNSVKLDGEIITPDSTRSGDVFYELHKSIDSFSGKHIIVFKSQDGKEYREEFDFEPLVLLTSLPDTITRDSLVFEFSGIKPPDQVRVILMDTTFGNDEDFVVGWMVNRSETVLPEKRQVVVNAESIARLSPGPVQIEFIRETEKDIDGPGPKGGKLKVTYTIKKEFFLKN
jgi:hypothetical protein